MLAASPCDILCLQWLLADLLAFYALCDIIFGYLGLIYKAVAQPCSSPWYQAYMDHLIY